MSGADPGIFERGGPEAIIYKFLERRGPKPLKMSFECSFQSFSYKYFANISQKGGAQAPWAPPLNPPLCVAFSHLISLVFITKDFHRHCSLEIERQLRLRLLFSLKPTEMAKMRLLAIWIDQRQSFKIAKKKL